MSSARGAEPAKERPRPGKRAVVRHSGCRTTPGMQSPVGDPRCLQRWHGGGVLTIFGVLALTFMMAMYGLESRGRIFVLAFALGCALSSAYGFLSGAWPFGAVEAVWVVLAVRRWWALPSQVAQ